MKQLTVNILYQLLKEAINEGYGDKILVVADDNEGNGFHGMFYGITYKEDEVKENLDTSFGRGLYDSQETNPKKLAIIG